MFVILLTADFKFRNRSSCSKGPIKRADKVCGDSQDLKSPGFWDTQVVGEIFPSGYCFYNDSSLLCFPRISNREEKRSDNESSMLVLHWGTPRLGLNHRQQTSTNYNFFKRKSVNSEIHTKIMTIGRKLTRLQAFKHKEASIAKTWSALRLRQLLQKCILQHCFSYTDLFDIVIYHDIINIINSNTEL